MKKPCSGISILLLMVFLVTQSVSARSRTPPAPLAFGTSYFERHAPGDVETLFRCDYPVFAPTSAGELINLVVMAAILSTVPLSESKPFPVTLESAANAFFEEFYDVIRKDPQLHWPWQSDINVKVILNQPDMVTVSIGSSIYTGGAHAMVQEHYLVFDSASGQRIGLNDLFVPGFESRLDTLIENRYRQMMGLSEREPLNSERGGLSRNSLTHTDNFAITGKGIVFTYNPYDIAPNSTGKIRIELTYDELREIFYPLNALKPINQ